MATGRRKESCEWCGREFDRRCATRQGRKACVACGVWSTWPQPDDAELDAAYSTWYRPETGRFSGAGDAILRLTRGRLAHRLNRIAQSGPILDVGAGDGTLLDSLAAVGRDVTGLERGSTRPDMLEAELSAVDGEWAAIVFWHSLEHLRGARDAIRQAARLLVGDGLLVIAVPDSSSLQARVFGDRWLALDMPRHLVHLTSRSLLEALRQEGFSVTRKSSYRGGQVGFGWLHGLVGMLPLTCDLYDAIRKPEARSSAVPPARRALTLLLACLLAPAAIALTIMEVVLRRGGTCYVEARLRPTSRHAHRLTGERVSSSEGSFNPTWQRHASVYALAADWLTDGRTLDLGCGVGHSFRLLGDRESIGMDIDVEALEAQDRPTVRGDMRALPFAGESFESVVCVHAIEHTPDPDLTVAEAARVLTDGGTAVFVTPNRLTFARPDEIIDPYHCIEFSADQLEELCSSAFAEVTIMGLQGSARQLAFVQGELARLHRLLALDPLGLRRFVPLTAKRILYDSMLRASRRSGSPQALQITREDFHLAGPGELDDSLDIIAVCRAPRRRTTTRAAESARAIA